MRAVASKTRPVFVRTPHASYHAAKVFEASYAFGLGMPNFLNPARWGATIIFGKMAGRRHRATTTLPARSRPCGLFGRPLGPRRGRRRRERRGFLQRHGLRDPRLGLGRLDVLPWFVGRSDFAHRQKVKKAVHAQTPREVQMIAWPESNRLLCLHSVLRTPRAGRSLSTIPLPETPAFSAPVCEHRIQSVHEPSSGRNWN